MVLIDPRGLFAGRRLRRCSNNARLLWPYIYCLRNSLGRMEIDPEQIAAEAFWSFEPRPTREEIRSAIAEYARFFLIFVYRSADNRIWGQWDTVKGSLPQYHTKEDLAAPSPDQKDLAAWRRRYFDGATEFNEFPESFINFVHRVGEVVVVGVGNISSPQTGEVSEEPTPESKSGAVDGTPSAGEPPEPPASPATDPDCSATGKPTAGDHGITDAVRDAWFEEEAWPLRWKSNDKATAKKYFRRHARTEAVKNQIVEAMRRERQAMLRRESEHRPYVSTWLNKRRFEDEPEEFALIPAPYANGAGGHDKREQAESKRRQHLASRIGGAIEKQRAANDN